MLARVVLPSRNRLDAREVVEQRRLLRLAAREALEPVADQLGAGRLRHPHVGVGAKVDAGDDGDARHEGVGLALFQQAKS